MCVCAGVFLRFIYLKLKQLFDASTIYTMLSHIFNQFWAQSETTYVSHLLFEEENQGEEDENKSFGFVYPN